MILLVKFLLAHLIGDFVLQPDSWVKDKEKKKYLSKKLYLHGLVHFILLLILIPDVHHIPALLTITISHIFIDAAKLEYQKEQNRRFWFFLDQSLHLVVLTTVAILISHSSISIPAGLVNRFIISTTGLILLLKPSSVAIKIILSKWAPATEFKTDKIETPSLLHAGKVIGYLERILVFVFILYSQWAAIGFLVTAKSVFRFSDLKQGQDRKLTEYILIGTLLSFSIAILTGLVTDVLIKITIA